MSWTVRDATGADAAACAAICAAHVAGTVVSVETEPPGTHAARRIGWKFGRWHDVAFAQQPP